jgi:tRNA uridine 5-carboxymethylaminomethyl modification enzyme
MRRPGIGFDDIEAVAQIAQPQAKVSRQGLREELGRTLADTVIEQVEVSIRYAGYIDKQHEEVLRAAHYEALPLPADLDYQQVRALSYEVRQRLTEQRPQTLGQASRLSGMTPAAVSLLLIHLKKGSMPSQGAANPGRIDAAA